MTSMNSTGNGRLADVMLGSRAVRRCLDEGLKMKELAKKSFEVKQSVVVVCALSSGVPEGESGPKVVRPAMEGWIFFQLVGEGTLKVFFPFSLFFSLFTLNLHH